MKYENSKDDLPRFDDPTRKNDLGHRRGAGTEMGFGVVILSG